MKTNNILMKILYFLLFFLLSNLSIYSQPHSKDTNTLLLLHFDNNSIGEDNEQPLSEKGISFEQGIFGNAVYLGKNSELTFNAANNISYSAGTFEFWINPKWNGSDAGDNYFFAWGSSAGMLFGKNGGAWRNIFNRFASGGKPEVQTIAPIKDFKSNTWHYIAITWNSTNLKLFIDGELKNQFGILNPLPLISSSAFQLGGDGGSSYINAVIDELRINNIERTADEIISAYYSGIKINSLSADTASIILLKSHEYILKIYANTDNGNISIPIKNLRWSSTDANIAVIDTSGKIAALSAGTAKLTGSLKMKNVEINVTVMNPVKEPEDEIIDPSLSAPAEGSLNIMPVVVFQYMPTKDGIYIDQSITELNSTIENLKIKLKRFSKRIKFMLEEGSKFRGYNNPYSVPSLGYKIIKIINVYEPFQIGKKVPWNPAYRPDYNQILKRFNGEEYVNKYGVKEFWVWGWHYKDIEPAESNMSSPTTGDISNSERYSDDLPVYKTTYTLYNYNYTRSQSEAIENHMHQLEAILSYADQRQNNNTQLFWQKFVGRGPNMEAPIGRAGDCHQPPNTKGDYDWANFTLVETDIEDWNPNYDGDLKKVNAYTWGNLAYNWPDSSEVNWNQEYSSKWFLYWMQNMPGYKNNIPYKGWNNINGDNRKMKNWWLLTAYWDSAMTNNIGLYEDINTSPEKETLISPWNGRKNVTLNPVFSWNPFYGASYYSIQVTKKQNDWNNLIINLNSIKGTTPFFKTTDSLEKNTKYYWRIKGTNKNGNGEWSDIFSFTTGELVKIEQLISFDYVLEQNYPNPFNPSTVISFILPFSGFTELKVYNSLGQEVKTIINKELPSGKHRYIFNAKDLAGGIYFYVLKSNNFFQVRKMALIR